MRTQSTKKLDVREQRRLKSLEPRSDLAETSVRDLDFSVKKVLDDLTLPIGKKMPPHDSSVVTVAGKSLNALRSNRCNAEYGASEREAKNLVQVETRIEKRAAGATTDFKGKSIEFLWHLKKQGRSKSTIETYAKFLNLLICKNVNDPEDVKDLISNQNWSNGTKTLYAAVYKSFAKFLGVEWEPPKYAVAEKLPFIPTEQEIDALIAGCGRKTSTFLQLLKETGARAGEIAKLKWIDVDFERRTVNITPEKGSKPRILPISHKAVEMLRGLSKNSDRIFAARNSMIGNFCSQRRRLAKKLGNPRLLKIHFHTLRHWKGTMEYHKTKDILHVMRLLGHRRIDNTMIYINLENAVFQATNEEFHVKVAKTPNEIKALLEVGFEYICEKDDLMYFKKRK